MWAKIGLIGFRGLNDLDHDIGTRALSPKPLGHDVVSRTLVLWDCTVQGLAWAGGDVGEVSGLSYSLKNFFKRDFIGDFVGYRV